MIRDTTILCDACEYNAPVKLFQIGGETRLCRLCAGSTPLNEVGNRQTISITICYVGNAILDALGFLWPDATVKPGAAGPTEIELQRDAFEIRVCELQERITGLDKEVEDAVEQRDAAIDAELEARLANNEVRTKIAELEARLAIMQPATPESTEDLLEVTD